MPYPTATADHLEFFNRHGWIVIDDAIDLGDLDALDSRCERLIAEKEQLAYDWAWDAKEKKEERSFRIVQASPTVVWPEIADQPYRKWLTAFGSALMSQKLDFWYDQFLAKPPGKSVPTYWHQDEGLLGRNLFDKGTTCWIPLQDVDAQNGCMQFIDGGHLDGGFSPTHWWKACRATS